MGEEKLILYKMSKKMGKPPKKEYKFSKKEIYLGKKNWRNSI